MMNIALRELILAAQELRTQVNKVLPPSQRKTASAICEQLKNLDRPAVQNKPRDMYFNSRIEAAFEKFRAAERTYLFGVDQEMARSGLGSTAHTAYRSSFRASSHLRSYFEVLLTLNGTKPCALMGPPPRVSPFAFTGVVLQCLVPMMEELELESYGFTLRYIAHDVKTMLNRDATNFKGGWIFADTRSTKWYNICDIFLEPHPDRLIEDKDLGDALGYPLPASGAKIQFFDKTETEEVTRVTGKEITVIAYEFLAKFENVAQEQALQTYILTIRRLGRDYGLELGWPHYVTLATEALQEARGRRLPSPSGP